MKFGIRIPSIKKRGAARTSVKRMVRHSLGLKAKRGWGWLTNPKKAAYNRVYSRTTTGCLAMIVAIPAVMLGLAGAIWCLSTRLIGSWASSLVAPFLGLLLAGCLSMRPEFDQKQTAAARPFCDPTPKTYFLIVSKSKVADPKAQQQRGLAAVRGVAEAAASLRPAPVIEALSEQVTTKELFRRGDVQETVTGEAFRQCLIGLAKTATPQDTVVVYTHTHGVKNGFEEAQPLGGIRIDLPVHRLKHAGVLPWDEYADLLLAIPARNVVVLTMSCFSGGLVEYLNSPRIKERWKDRRRLEGRNLIVLTSQNKDLVSPPIVKDGEVINPFTLAVTKAFAWEADGFELIDGKSAKLGRNDAKLTVAELIDYILYTTENTTSQVPRRKNIAKPQLTGSFDRSDVLFERVDVPVSDTRHGTAQQAAPADAYKPRR